ncbi:MAG: hypothetical protein ACJ71Z_13885 [Aeromicrobium sp.]
MTSPTCSPDVTHAVRLTDPRIDESSGLACSVAHPNVVYTLNDEDGPVFVIDASSGETAGTFRIEGAKLGDPEALSLGPDGMLWIADIGANRGKKKAFALYALAEPGPGDHGVLAAVKYRIAYPTGGRPDAEAFLVHPITGDGYVMTRQSSGRLYRFAAGQVEAGRKNTLELVASDLPARITDGCFTVDGRFALVRQQGRRKTVTVLDPTTWQVVDEFSVPRLKQPESIAADPDGRHVWIGSEGVSSPLIRVALPAPFVIGS